MRLKILAATLAFAASVFVAMTALGTHGDTFDFYGFAVVPTTSGGTLTVRTEINNNGVNPTPIALDFDTNQYTLVLTATLIDAGPPQQYSPATVKIYCDSLTTGTAADFATPGTFTDGELILEGSFDGNLTRTSFPPPFDTGGSYTGALDFTGGTRLGELHTTQDWPFGGGWNRNTSIEPGYDEFWDGKIDEPEPVSVREKSWSELKNLFR